MEEYVTELAACQLFAGIPEMDIHQMLLSLNAAKKQVSKNTCIFSCHEPIHSFGIVLTGSVHVIQEDFWGNATILTRVGKNALFGEAYSWAGKTRLPVSVIAAEETVVLLLNSKKLLTLCPAVCRSHTRLIENMLQILAEKNIILVHKIGHLTKRTTREKLLSYLSEQALAAGSNNFMIPFNRQELAAYLAVDRSAMSYELSKMRREGLVDFQRSSFKLLR